MRQAIRAMMIFCGELGTHGAFTSSLKEIGE